MSLEAYLSTMDLVATWILDASMCLEWTGIGNENIYLGRISLEQNIWVCMKNNHWVLSREREQTFDQAILLYWFAFCCTILRCLWIQSSPNKSLASDLGGRKDRIRLCTHYCNFLSCITSQEHTCGQIWQCSECCSSKICASKQDPCIALLLHPNYFVKLAWFSWSQLPTQNLFHLPFWTPGKAALELTGSCTDISRWLSIQGCIKSNATNAFWRNIIS